MDSQQIMEFLLAIQAKADARHEQMMADRKAWREEMRASHEEMEFELIPETEVKTMACQEERQPTSLDRKPEAVQKEEVPKVDAEVMLVREPKKNRRRD
jgi:hypothetical protein